MATYPDGCPYDPATRAERCVGCLDETGGSAPCAIAWLRAHLVETRMPISLVAHRLVRQEQAQEKEAAERAA